MRTGKASPRPQRGTRSGPAPARQPAPLGPVPKSLEAAPPALPAGTVLRVALLRCTNPSKGSGCKELQVAVNDQIVIGGCGGPYKVLREGEVTL